MSDSMTSRTYLPTGDKNNYLAKTNNNNKILILFVLMKWHNIMHLKPLTGYNCWRKQMHIYAYIFSVSITPFNSRKITEGLMREAKKI